MMILTRRTILFFFVILCTPLSDVKPQAVADKKTATASISGTVTLKGKGAAGIAIAVRSANRGNSRSAIYQVKTDQEGHYRISNVLAGSYEVSPNAPGFVVSMRSGSAAIIVGEGETIDDVNFSLTKGAVITGRVTNSEGQPLVEQGVALLPVDNNNQSFRSQSMFFVQSNMTNNMTDDRGIYRIFGLAQGKYKVSVGQSADSLGSSRRGSIRQTFYPGVNDFSKAAIVEVSEGGEAKNIDITAETNDNSQRFAATGRIIDGVSGEPVSNLNLGLQRTSVDRSESVSGFLSSDNQGKFKIEGLSPGKYGIFIEGGLNSDLRADPVPFEIVDADVDGIVIKTVRGASVSGQIFLESDDKSIRSKLNQLGLSANVNVNTQSSFHSYGKSVRIKQDLSFQIGGLQEGLVDFSVYSLEGGPLRGVSISRIERDGLVQTSGVEVKDGEQVTGLKIFLNVNTGTIRGVVKTEHGELPPTARISVWLSNSGAEAGRMQPQSMPGPTVDSRGRFIVEGVAAGTYEVNANVFIPDARRSFSAKQQVNVSDGVVSEVTLNIDLSPQPL
ncbi:MAG TPA: carboxypeptidase regulatory-like domain-containing protein [Pyrinomonadaceae bacterium]|nr:carboxypeptidase regulatory-like domain-containing protein [Pyrinomonadaceae bacterium]